MSKVSEASKKNLVSNPIQKGEVRNPNGYPKGMKNARTIVREFMDKTIDTISGTPVTRFQYLLWSMYEVSVRLERQASLRFKFLEESRIAYEDALALYKLDKKEYEEREDHKELPESIEKEVAKLKREYKRDATDYERLLEQIQNSNTKLSEFLLKASGQYQEEIGINNAQPVTIEVSKQDIKEAARELEGEF
jgi:hypothetical protein